MGYAFYILFAALSLCCTVMTYALLVRALLSWFIPPNSGNRFAEILTAITECVVAPVRALMEKFSFTQRLPIDLSLLVACLLLQLLSGVFSTIGLLLL